MNDKNVKKKLQVTSYVYELRVMSYKLRLHLQEIKCILAGDSETSSA